MSDNELMCSSEQNQSSFFPEQTSSSSNQSMADPLSDPLGGGMCSAPTASSSSSSGGSGARSRSSSSSRPQQSTSEAATFPLDDGGMCSSEEGFGYSENASFPLDSGGVCSSSEGPLADGGMCGEDATCSEGSSPNVCDALDGGTKVDDLADLTPSQKAWIENLRKLELLNPSATAQDLAMALSLRIWSADQMWDKNGKSQYPGLILDYKGGPGYKDVKFPDKHDKGADPDAAAFFEPPGTTDEGATGLTSWPRDTSGQPSNANHAFPAVAVEAGRSDAMGSYGSFMATSGGDFIENVGLSLFGEGGFKDGEEIGNSRGRAVADDVHDGGRMSDSMLSQFREENANNPAPPPAADAGVPDTDHVGAWDSEEW